MSIKTLIVGLGKVGMMYDYNNKISNYTHAQSINNSPYFDLLGGVDISSKKRKKFVTKFRKPAFNSIKSAHKDNKYDLIIISVPTIQTQKIYLEIIKKKIVPKAILFEKPVSNKLSISKKIFTYCERNKIKIFVNYNRRYDISTRKIKEKFKKNFIGDIKHIDVIYHKGLFNSCSHYLNYLNLLFSDKNKLISVNNKHQLKDDYLVDFHLKNKNFDINFVSRKNQKESIKIYGTLGKFVYYTEKDIIYFLKTNKKKQQIQNNYSNGQKNVLKNIAQTLKNKAYPYSTSIDAIETLKYIEKITRKLK